MPAAPHRPPLAMKLWLSRRLGLAGGTDESAAAVPGHPLGKTMHIESVEHVVRNRVRTFLRHTLLVTILGTIALGAAIVGAVYFFTAPTTLRIAAGPPESASVKLVQLLTQKFAADHDTVRLELVPTAGPKETAEAIANDRADLAILPSTAGKSPDGPVVAILRQNVVAFVVPPPVAAAGENEAAAAPKKEASAGTSAKSSKADKAAAKAAAKSATKSASAAKSKGGKGGGDKATKTAKADDADADDDSGGDGGKFQKVPQLAGARIGIVTGNVATTDLLAAVLGHYGVPLGKVQVSLIDPKDVADAVKANQVDVLFVAGAATGAAINGTVAAATRDGKAPTFVAIDQAEGIAKRNAAFDSADIDAGTFGGNPPAPADDFKSLSFAEYLVARKSVSHEAIGTLAKLIYTSRLALAAAMPGEIKIQAPSTDKDAGVVVHPGALAYLGDDQKSFFDKYGDDIFYGMLIFPLFGSAIAGVAGYFRSSGRTKRLRLLQKILDLVRKAHAAPSLEALDQLQVEVDHHVVAIIHQTEHENYDQNEQMSFSLALDQVRFAIEARRAALLGGAEAKPGAKAAAA
jgi:TRAP-type uncharacterized transport system substrate-binding protein